MDADYSAQRTKMVDGQIRTTDVTNAAVIAAMLSVPREAFVPARLKELAYIDEDLEIAAASSGSAARYLMEPSPFAKLVQLAEIGPADLVLDVGAGCGYAAAVLSRIGKSVVALESDSTLAASASAALARLGYDNVAVVEGTLAEGCASKAPYDVILVGGAVDAVPDSLTAQLKDGGRLVAVVGRGNSGVARLYRRDGQTISSRRAFNAAVRPLPGFQREAVFEF